MLSPSTTTALSAPLIEANGCFMSSSTGVTLALNPPSFSTTATSLIVLSSLLAHAKSSFVISEIPFVNTSSDVGVAPKQIMDKIMALYCASIPSTSFVGSGSAYPNSWASLNASS